MNRPARNSLLCPNCRKLIRVDEKHCPHCGIPAPGSRWKNNPLTRGWGSGESIVRLIIYVNIGMFLISVLIDPRSLSMGFNPLRFFSPSTRSLEVLGATGTRMFYLTSGWWTLISANYLHGGLLHIFFNLLVLYQISPLITQIYGPYRYFIIYTVSGILGFFVSLLFGVSLTIGASASLCGLIGAAIYYGKSRGGPFGQAVYRQIGVWALAILLLGFLWPGINNYAHIGGMASGALGGLVLGYNDKAREGFLHRALAGACAVLTVLVLLWSLWRALQFVLGGF